MRIVMRPLGVFTRAMVATLLVLASADAPCLAGIIHDYELNGSFADSLGGPALVPAGGTLNATNYSFAPNQGLSLSSWLTGWKRRVCKLVKATMPPTVMAAWPGGAPMISRPAT